MDTHQVTCIEHSRSAKYAATRYKGVPTYKHRVAYIVKHGLDLLDIKDRVVRHTCDNCKCLNPDHLVLGTQADNMADMWERTRERPHQKHYEAIKAEYVRGSKECGQPALARKYGVSQTHISRIVNSN
jgi:hypothetical protein